MPRSARYRAQGARFGGYSLVELVVVISIAGILAAYIAPRFWTQQTFSDRGYVDELAAALRSTQKAAVITGCAAQLTLSPSSYAARQQAPAGNACSRSPAQMNSNGIIDGSPRARRSAAATRPRGFPRR